MLQRTRCQGFEALLQMLNGGLRGTASEDVRLCTRLVEALEAFGSTRLSCLIMSRWPDLLVLLEHSVPALGSIDKKMP